uniref:Protein kinase domain-containing protein n=1 Tax=Globisporangium ultimum (strain ATCC 200006 / CBS 805.95 / DAOM BR144) TaxID=431595 RepID=K3X147_GLOUD
MLLSAMRSKARSNATTTTSESSSHAPPPPQTTKKQRSIHDFFAQDIVRETARKKREPVVAKRLAKVDAEPVTKRIDYDSSSSSGMQDDDDDSSSNDGISASQSSDGVAFNKTPRPHPKPKKIDFSFASSQRSEPDGEPNEIASGRFGHSVVSSQQPPGFLENLSAPHFSQHMYSQDDMDFLTPMDQPVMHLSHPTTPSPLKKRQRRDDGSINNVDMIREEEVQNLTQDMTHMDVCHRLGVPPPSFSTDSMPSPREMFPSTPQQFSDTPAKSFHPGKRRSRPISNAVKGSSTMTTTATSNSFMDSFVNPFAPVPASDSKKKRSHRKRQSFPAAWGSGVTAAPMSKYLTDFNELELLGSGSFSKVYKCMKKLDGWVYAVKKSKRHFRGKADTERALREVQALAALSNSRHVVRYFDAWIEDDLLYIQLENCQGCSLGGMLDKFKPHHIPEATLCKVLCHIAQALHDMHTKKMVHMDVKLQNVLVAEGDIYKLGDLGTVAHMDGSMEITEGDNRYLSRELLEGSRTDLRAGDIFALGATIYELALGSTLPSGGEDWQRIRDGDLAMFRQYSNSLQHLIASMMHPDPLQRPLAEEILQHEVVLPFRS